MHQIEKLVQAKKISDNNVLVDWLIITKKLSVNEKTKQNNNETKIESSQM